MPFLGEGIGPHLLVERLPMTTAVISADNDYSTSHAALHRPPRNIEPLNRGAVMKTTNLFSVSA